MHRNNIHKNGYDFEALSQHYPDLKPFLTISTKGKTSIDFANSKAVKALNSALLSRYYAIHFWDIPDGYLCPAVPGRADYIHHIAELLAKNQTLGSPKRKIVGLDIGTGANLVYPIIGSQAYKWHFIASDIEQVSFSSAKTIIEANSHLKKRIKLRLQKGSTLILQCVTHLFIARDKRRCLVTKESLEGLSTINENAAARKPYFHRITQQVN